MIQLLAIMAELSHCTFAMFCVIANRIPLQLTETFSANIPSAAFFNFLFKNSSQSGIA